MGLGDKRYIFPFILILILTALILSNFGNSNINVKTLNAWATKTTSECGNSRCESGESSYSCPADCYEQRYTCDILGGCAAVAHGSFGEFTEPSCGGNCIPCEQRPSELGAPEEQENISGQTVRFGCLQPLYEWKAQDGFCRKVITFIPALLECRPEIPGTAVTCPPTGIFELPRDIYQTIDWWCPWDLPLASGCGDGRINLDGGEECDINLEPTGCTNGLICSTECKCVNLLS